jgi:PAS domain S-box-containing protein
MEKPKDSKSAIKVLYLEDSKEDFEIIAELLIDNGFDLKMDHVENEPEFVTALHHQKYDIILSDFILPGYDAFKALEKTIEICPEVPVIVVSGAVGEEMAIELIKEGAIDYILKDKPDRLPSAIKRARQEADKKAELILVEKTVHLYQDIIKNMVIGLYVYHLEDIEDDTTLRLIFVNQSAELYTGVAYQDVIGKTLDENFPGLRKAGVPQLYAQVVISGKYLELGDIFYGDERVEENWFRVRAFPLPDNCVGISFDKITERKLAEDAIRKEKEYSDNLIISMTDGFSILDARGVHVDVNPALCRMTGFSREELIEVGPPHPYWPPEEYERIENAFQKTLQGQVGDLELIFMRKNGERFPVIVSPVYVKDKEGEFINFFATLKDITKRKKVEMELKMLSMAIEQSAEMVVITDTKGLIEYNNTAFEEITGYSSAEVLGLNPSILKSGKQDDAFYKDLWETISTGSTWRGNLINRRKDGSLYTENTIISPLLDESGGVTHYIGVKRDISAELDLQQQLIQSQKLESIGNLAGGVAHDFNNILTIIKSYSELLLSKLSDRKDLEEFVLRIDEAADRATALTRQLLAFSRKQVLQMEPVDLNYLIGNMENIMKRLIGEKYGLFTDLQADPSIIKADSHQIDQSVMNLCVNACDAMPLGGKIFLRTMNMEDSVALVVEDTGEGIDPGIITRIFEPFFTTKEIDKGTGLGLSVIFGIVEQHQGKISVDSPPGKGARFCIEFKSSLL